MKKVFTLLLAFFTLNAMAQSMSPDEEIQGMECTTITVGKKPQKTAR